MMIINLKNTKKETGQFNCCLKVKLTICERYAHRIVDFVVVVLFDFSCLFNVNVELAKKNTNEQYIQNVMSK